jgi:hypothetical protein
MNKFDSNMSRLFRSVGADESEARASTSAVAQEAEQRWPLLKAVPPAKHEPTPPLHPRARQHMGPAGRPVVSGRKPALTLPSLGDKLATSLNKMAAKPVIARSSISAPETEHANMAPLSNFTSNTAGLGKSFTNPAQDSRQSMFASHGTGREQPDDTANLFIRPARPVKSGMIARDDEEPARQDTPMALPTQRVEELAVRAQVRTSEAKPALFGKRMDEPAQQPDTRSGLFGKRVEQPGKAEKAAKSDKPAGVEKVEFKSGLFGKKPEKDIIAKSASSSPREKRLSDIFAQIEGNGAKVIETESRSSIFNRLGKR